MRPLVWLDLETTGLDERQHEIIEFAAVREDGAELCFKIQPEHIETAHPRALEVNGYTPEAWAAEDALSLENALHRIVAFCKDLAPNPAGQNVAFDLRFLQAAFRDYKINWPFGYHSVDTMTLAQEHLKPLGQRSLSLHNLCETLRISNDGEHTAMADVHRTMAVWNKLCRANALQRLVWSWRIRKLNKAADAAKAAKKKADA
jgi:DNA polymerase III epsilon subunit-like protein